ncbi:dephospho-CoA kinase [Georgenia sp. Z1491]|uniref:dephospho-CoA kinase n=1 Tax=Georgenia sp. Z1491 TaxID=3416707 RepID=UPI003CFA36E2
MLTVGLTGGIASGKSTVSAELARLGAVVVDADVLARKVVEPGTPGLRAVVEEWGPGVLADDGTLDRAALGAIVFADPEARRRLGEITHPLVHAEHVRLEAEAVAADPAAVVVHDVALVVEADLAHRYHLLLVVHAPEDVRIGRMVERRGMTVDEARARVAAQATDDQRRAVADIWLDNTGTPDELRTSVDRVWSQRIRPYEANVRAGVVADRSGGPVLLDPASRTEDGRDVGALWAAQGARLVSRVGAVLRAAGIPADVSHVGSTAVPGLVAKDVIDLQVGVDDLDDDRVTGVLAAAGFPVRDAEARDRPHPADGPVWRKRFHLNADPGRDVNLHVRESGSPGWRYALAMRDALRDDTDARRDYAAMKEALAARHATDARTGGYAEGKEPWFGLRGTALVAGRLAGHGVVPDLDLRDASAA